MRASAALESTPLTPGGRILRRTIGLVLIMIGGFWAAISLGFLEESFMTGQPVYTVLGAIVAIAGVLVLVVKPKSRDSDVPPPGTSE